MSKKFVLAAIFLTLFVASAHAADSCEQLGLATGKNGWCAPKMRLTGNLSKIFAIGECEAISGLTCRIKYDGELPLPSEVFFVELDANGKGLGKAVRLIYPELKSGSQGLATFRLKHDAKIIELRGKWDGPWKNPY